MVLTRQQGIRWIAKLAVFALCLAPLVWLAAQVFLGGLGANPIEATNRFLGDWALRFLLIALAVTPVKDLTGWTIIMRFRRMLGLFAFFYVSLHLASYVVLDQFFAWSEIWGDIVKRRYITVGMVAFVLLIPLAITSTKGMIQAPGRPPLDPASYACIRRRSPWRISLLHDGEGRYPGAADLRNHLGTLARLPGRRTGSGAARLHRRAAPFG